MKSINLLYLGIAGLWLIFGFDLYASRYISLDYFIIGFINGVGILMSGVYLAYGLKEERFK